MTRGLSALGFKVTGGYRILGSESFLKGMWYLTSDGEIWGPCLSRILKIGKASRDPRIVFNEENLELAAKKHAAVVAAGYKDFLQVPILECYVRNFVELGIKGESVPEWKIAASGRYSRSIVERGS